jgi:hypothetical protein
MQKRWLTVKQVSLRIQRSHQAVYRLIYKSERGQLDPPLGVMQIESGVGRRWMIEEASLETLGEPWAEARPYVKDKLLENGGQRKDGLTVRLEKSIRYDNGDTPAKVLADRTKWIKGWIEEGKTLSKVLSVFDASLHPEIEHLYWQMLEQAEAAQDMV